MSESQQSPVEKPELSEQADENEPKKDSVAYDTYRKVLGEKKRRDEQLRELSEELESFRAKEKERQESELKAKEDYKKLLELKNQELTEYRQRFETLNEQTTNATKLTSFLENLDGKVSQKYWDKIPMSEIVIDPDSGRPDELSLKKAIDKFRAEYPEIIQKGGAPNIPAKAPKSVSEGVGSSKEELYQKLAQAKFFQF